MPHVPSPFLAPAPPEVPLPAAPLVRVLTQIRFPEILSVDSPDFIAGFQESIRRQYPELVREQGQLITIEPQREPVVRNIPVWRFFDETRNWRASLARDFVALETKQYISRDDFLGRLELILKAIENTLSPNIATRIGLRYVDRLTGEAAQDIASLVRPEVLGVQSSALGQHAEYVMTEAQLHVGEAQMLWRCGSLPPGATVDPDTIEPVAVASWVLDMDMFTAERQPFKAASLLEVVRRFADRQYAAFRWAVTDEFLRRFGGQV